MNDRPCTVYRVRDDAGRLLYIGSTIDLSVRFRAHERVGADWLPYAAFVELDRFDNEFDARTSEAVAIVREQPHYNRAGTGRSFRASTPPLPPSTVRVA